MTRIRSESERISSSSSETSRTARPSSRSSTRRRWTNSIAPTSRPRVGWAAISTRGSRSISRASTTFCWFPPDSAADGWEAAVVEHLEVLDLEQRLARLRRLLLHAQEHLAPDHEARELLLRRPRCRERLDHLPAAEDRHPVGDLRHLVQLVADED